MGVVSKANAQKYKRDKEGGYDITNCRFGKLVATELIPKGERKNLYQRREWKCKCDCGNEIIVEQRNLLSARFTKSCGCIREKVAFQETVHLDLDFEWLDSFSDFKKVAFIHRTYRGVIGDVSHLNKEQYMEIIEHFYNNKQFNDIYSFWKQQEKQTNTFYDWAKPSIDHIIPKSKGGNNDLSNLQYLTVFENLAKRDMTMEEWEVFKKETNTHSNFFYEEIKKGGDAI